MSSMAWATLVSSCAWPSNFSKSDRVLHCRSVPTQMRTGQHLMGQSAWPNSQCGIDYQPTIRSFCTNQLYTISYTSSIVSYFLPKSAIAVPDMVSRYAANDTPVEISRMRKVYLPVSEMKEVWSCTFQQSCIDQISFSSATSTLALRALSKWPRNLRRKRRKICCDSTEKSLEKIGEFRLNISHLHVFFLRSALLVRFLAHSLMEGAVLLNEAGEIIAWAGITTTGFESDRLFKLAPVRIYFTIFNWSLYCAGVRFFARRVRQTHARADSILREVRFMTFDPFERFTFRSSPDARILVQILTGTVSESELETAIGELLRTPFFEIFTVQSYSTSFIERPFEQCIFF